MINKKDGSSDADRFNTALTESSFKIHDLSNLELLSYSSHCGKFIKYFNNENNADGTWSDLISNDELGIIAEIMNYTCKYTISNMNYQLRSSDKSVGVLKACINKTFSIIGTIDTWIKLLSHIDRQVARLFHRQIYQLIENNFIQHYATFLSIVKTIVGQNAKVSLPQLYGPWKNVKYETVGRCEGNEFQGKLSTILYALYGVITSIKKYAEIFCEDSLNRKDHSPEIAMFITFLELFKKIQAQVNTLPEKYALFYYEKILQFSRNEAVADTVYVTLLCNSREAIVIPEGTEFTAEVEGKTIFYQCNKSTMIKSVSVESVCSISLEKSKFKEPEKSLGFYTGIVASEKMNTNAYSNVQTLTHQKNINDGTRIYDNVNLGFAIASKIFFLSEGRRKIICTFTITDDLVLLWNTDFKKKLLELSDMEYNENSWTHEFIKIFRSLFKIELTIENGWYTVEMYQPNASIIDPSIPKNTIQFEFTIPVNAPSIVSYDKNVHGYTFSSQLPICKMMFNSNSELFPYSFLKNIAASDVHIDVSVEGATGLLLYNQYGPLESSTPFTPFGPIPIKGENFIIGYHELASKSIQSIDLEIEWGNVPWQQDGFSEVYEGYSYPFNNNSFKVKISELRDGIWVDLDDEEKQSIILYNTDNTSPQSEYGIGPVVPYTNINSIKLTNFKEKAFFDDMENYQYTNKSKNRFIRITLIAPDCGFGQSIYTNDLSSALIKKIHNKNGSKLPCQPYCPLINLLRMNYKAKTKLYFSKSETDQHGELSDAFYHIVPFGVDKVSPGSGNSNVSLIPLIDKTESKSELPGNLFIGIKGETVVGELSLLFNIDDDTEAQNIQKVNWFYLSNNKWIQLGQKNILSDTTYELSCTGIITFNIPKEITSNNTIMKTGFYWLRGATGSTGECLKNIQSIITNGIQLTGQTRDDALDVSLTIPVDSVKGLTRQIAGIDSVTQQAVATGGIKKETTHSFMTRVSETLRHKNRLMTTRDYEQVILEKFKDIYKVKCFRNFSSCNTIRNIAGNIVLCVIPNANNHCMSAYQCPRVPLHRLHAIKEYLQKYTTSTIALEVINPVYEKIQIRCSIEPKDFLKSGDLLSIVNHGISEYISPWSPKGNKTCFGWRIVLSEVKKFISEIPDVKRVTNFSVLHKKSPISDKYELDDTAEEYTLGNNQYSIVSKIPWSIGLPFRHHAIEIVDNNIYGKGHIAGISKMDIDNIFIIKGQNHGDTEQKNT